MKNLIMAAFAGMLLSASLARADSKCQLKCQAFNEKKTYGTCEIWMNKEKGYILSFDDLPKDFDAQEKLTMNDVASCAHFYAVQMHVKGNSKISVCVGPTQLEPDTQCAPLSLKSSLTAGKGSTRVFPK